MKITVGFAFSAVLLAGCSTASLTCGYDQDTRCEPIHNVINSPINTPAGKTVSMDALTQAIQRAGAVLGWQMQPVSPGRIYGRLELRKHVAIVDIEHDTKSYSIKYRESSNLNAGGGLIHRNYNSWIKNLDSSIQTQLQLASSRVAGK